MRENILRLKILFSKIFAEMLSQARHLFFLAKQFHFGRFKASLLGKVPSRT